MGSKWGVFSWVMLQGATTKLRYAFPYPKISNTRVPIKIAFFVWLIHHGAIQHKTARVPGAILTQDNLVKGVWISVNWWIFCSKKKLKPSVTCLCTAPLLCSLVRLTCFLLGCWLSFQSPWSLLYCIFFFFFFFFAITSFVVLIKIKRFCGAIKVGDLVWHLEAARTRLSFILLICF